MSAFHAFSATIIILVSCLAMLIIYKNKKLQNIQGIFRFNLAVADCLSSTAFIGSTIAPYYYIFQPIDFQSPVVSTNQQSVHQLAHKFYRDGNIDDDEFEKFFLHVFKSDPSEDFLVTLFGVVCYSGGFASMYSYLIASIDRFIAVRYPFKYKRKASKRNAFKSCIVIWVIAILSSLTPVFNQRTKYTFFRHLFVFYSGQFELFLDLIILVLPLFFCWILNIITLCSINRSTKKMLKRITTIQIRTTNASNLETRVSSAAKTISIMVFAFTLSYLPFNVQQFDHYLTSSKYDSYNSYYVQNKNTDGTDSNLEYVFCVVLLYNNFWNFFIYNVRDPRFRECSKSLFCCFKKTLRRR